MSVASGQNFQGREVIVSGRAASTRSSEQN
jgi:hypothetical protein